jgi:hypothetical protein
MQILGQPEIDTKAGRKLADIEDRWLEARRKLRDKQLAHQTASAEAAATEREFITVEARRGAGQATDKEVEAAAKRATEARERAGQPWAREVEVCQQTVALLEADWERCVADNYDDLSGAVKRDRADALARVDAGIRAALEAVAAYEHANGRLIRLAVPAGRRADTPAMDPFSGLKSALAEVNVTETRLAA